MKRIHFALRAALFAQLALGFHLSAQVTGRLTGSVVDASGAAVPGAVVSLLLVGGSTPVLTTATTREGLFSLTAVPPEFYDLVVEARGFHRHTLRNLKVDPGRETALPAIRVEVEAVAEVVEVRASGPEVQTSNAEISTTVTSDQVRRLPILDRRPWSLLLTQGGVNANGRSGPVINGQRISSTNVTLDGINIQDNFIRAGATSYTPNFLLLDQVAEFTIATSNTSAAVSGGASQVTYVTPSGTNHFHGLAYWYNRNNAFAANSWFNNRDGLKDPFLNQNQVGGSLGGPILRDKLFFYTNYEAFRMRQQSTANRVILTEDARRGIFSYEDLQGSVRRVNILQAAGVPMDPVIRQILNLVPAPEKINNFRTGDSRESLLRNTAGYAFLIRTKAGRDNTTAKLDYILSPKNALAGSYVWNREVLDRPDASNDYTQRPKVFNDDGKKLLSVAWRWSPTPRFTQELRGGFNRGPQTFKTREKFDKFILAGMVFSNPVNTLQFQGRNVDTFHWMGNAGYVRGRHHLQFGFQTQQVRVESFDEGGTIPTYFLGLGAGNPGLTAAQLPGIRAADLGPANALLATLAGYITSYSQRFNVTSRDSGFVNGATQRRNFSLDNYALYAQDSWKLMRRLTLTLGLRYDYYAPVDERDALLLLPRIVNNNPIATVLSDAVLDFTGSSVGRPLYKKDRNNFAPNIGLAYDPSGKGKTALRAGYSIHYVNDENILAIFSNADLNPGLSANASRFGLSARISTGLPAIETPVFQVPRTIRDNFRLSPSSFADMPDPGLVTPYVQQWTFGIQHQFKGTVLEARYVGNHGTKLFRGFDYNQVDVLANGFLDDFRRAQSNGRLARSLTGVFDPNYNPSIPGSQALTVFPLLPDGGRLNQATFRNWIETGEAGTLAFQYHFNGLNGSLNFVPNPFALAGAIMLTNYSNSSYNALQVEVLRRTPGSLQLQANYTFSKVLTDSSGSFNRFDSFLDRYNAKIERARAQFDLTHAIKANVVYDLPVGQGHRLNFRPIQRLLSGWATSGILTWQSGAPFSVLSGRGTLTGGRKSSANTADTTLTKSQLDKLFRFRQTGFGPYFIAASAIGSDGRAVAPDGRPPFEGQVFFHPGPGTIGGLQKLMFSGPWVFNLDFALLKAIKITERQSVEFRMEAANIFNHPSWIVGDQFIGASSFGRVFSTVFDRRLIQFSLHYRF